MLQKLYFLVNRHEWDPVPLWMTMFLPLECFDICMFPMPVIWLTIEFFLNQSIFFRPILFLGNLPCAGISGEGGLLYWGIYAEGKMAGYDFPCWRSRTFRVDFGFRGKYNQGFGNCLKNRTAKWTVGVAVSRRKFIRVALGLPDGSVVSISYSTPSSTEVAYTAIYLTGKKIAA